MDSNSFACVPYSFMIVVDDVGWWRGDDHRYKNGPSRSGIGRRHCAEDYRAIIELGRSLNMRIKCGFVVGEWDRTNILARVRNSNKYGAKWDNGSRLDPSIDEVADIINEGQDYMELALHGTMHMYWTDTGVMKPAEFFQMDEETGRYIMTSPDIIRDHLDAYFEICHQNGLPMDIESFIPPCFNYVFSPYEDKLSAILTEYGIKYISTPFKSMQYTTEEKPVDVGVENGIITVDRTSDWTPWDGVGLSPPKDIKRSYYGMHWPNFLNENPQGNMDVVKRWVDYFSQYGEKFDILPARDNAMGSAQALYKRFLKIKTQDNTMTLDFKDVNGQDVRAVSPSFYINVFNQFRPKTDNSLHISVYEANREYTTYMVTRRDLLMKEGIINFTSSSEI